MAIAKRMYVILATLFVCLAATAPMEAQLTCGWCLTRGTLYTGPGIILVGDIEHRFPGGGDECGWDGHDECGVQCSRCGGKESTCHTDWWVGICHVPCGTAVNDALATLTEIEEAFDTDDMAVVATVLSKNRTGVSVEFIPDAGRIDLILANDPGRPFHTIPVLPDARDRLGIALAAYSSAGIGEALH